MHKHTLVVDAGSFFIKTATETAISRERNVVGKPNSYFKASNATVFVGDAAIMKQCKLLYPIERGAIANFQHWQHIMQYNLDKHEQTNCIISAENCHAPLEKRKRAMEIMFENLHVNNYCSASAQALALLDATGQVSGNVFEFSYGGFRITSLVNGLSTSSDLPQFENWSGQDMEQRFINSLAQQGIHSTRGTNFELVRDMMHCSFTCIDSEKTTPFNYELPDGNVFELHEASRYTIPNTYPSALLSMRGHFSTILQASNNNLLTGGWSHMPGFHAKFATALQIPHLQLDQRPFQSVVRGGLLLSKVSHFASMCISKTEYEEVGDSILQIKCPIVADSTTEQVQDQWHHVQLQHYAVSTTPQALYACSEKWNKLSDLAFT